MAARENSSPFTPGVPVPPWLFAGRESELESIVRKCGKAVANGTLERVFVTGERGIGKSSFCKIAGLAAEKEHNVLSVHVMLGGTRTLEEMVRRIYSQIVRESVERPWYNKLAELLGKHIRQVGLYGIDVEFDASDKDLHALVDNFAAALHKLMGQLKPMRKGLMLVLDDLNGLTGQSELANWLKSFVDGISTSGKEMPMLLVMAGLPERRYELIKNNESLNRVFDVVTLGPLTPGEVRKFFSDAFARVSIEVTDAAMNMLCDYSTYPAFAQEIGDSTFAVDSDDEIDFNDATSGVMAAVDTIGVKFIEPKVAQAIRSGSYQSILATLPLLVTGREFSKRDIEAKLQPHERKVFHNFLSKMRSLGILESLVHEKGQGWYRFSSDLYRLYFLMQSIKKGRASGHRAGAT